MDSDVFWMESDEDYVVNKGQDCGTTKTFVYIVKMCHTFQDLE